MTLTLDEARWLVGADATLWLARLADDRRPLHQQAGALRKELSARQSHLLLEQVELRRLGRRKFSAAATMYFTRVGLEQATDEVIATYKAQRLLSGLPHADLCCGIGGDLLATAQRGAISGIERQPGLAVLAAANLRAQGFDACGPDAADTATSGPFRVLAEEVGPGHVADVSAWHIDPDRRPAKRRTTQVELHEPGLEQIDALRAVNPHCAIKLAPASVLPPHWDAESQREWISRARECRQQVAWFGQLAGQSAARRATILTDGAVPVHVEGPADVPLEAAGRVGRYVYEPDSAVLAAGLTGSLAREHELQALAADIVYLTADHVVAHPALAGFEVNDVLPFRPRKLKRLLAERGVGRLEVKKRGVPHDPAQVQRQLQATGTAAATLILTRAGERVVAILARRVDAVD